jgi:hypothetical protein
MPITTIKHCQGTDDEWSFTVSNIQEDSNTPGQGLTIKLHATNQTTSVKLSCNLEDTLLIRDAINQLYPPKG